MSDFLYCIDCEKMVQAENGKVFGHLVPVWNEFGGEIDFCEFPMGFASCPPPEQRPDWIEYVDDPSPEEMDVFNSNATLLLADLEAR